MGGILGQGISDPSAISGENIHNYPPINLGPGVQVTNFALSSTIACATLTNGYLVNFLEISKYDRYKKCWGNVRKNYFNATVADYWGDSPSDMGNNLPYWNIGDPAISVSISTQHICVLTTTSRVKCLGYNYVSK